MFPTIFWVAQDGEIEVSSVGWVKTDFEEINRRDGGGREYHSGDGVQAGGRCARLPRGLRVEKLAPGRRADFNTITTEGTEEHGGNPGIRTRPGGA